MMRPITIDDIEAAVKRVDPFIYNTPLLPLSSSIVQIIRSVARDSNGNDLDFDIRLKCENFQRVGAFKFRGASNAVQAALAENPGVKIVATHSSGNHAAAIALSCELAGLESLLVVPTTAPQVKVDAILGYSGNIEFCAPTERESTLQAVVEKKRALFGNDSVVVIPPFNDPLVMAGQGTLAIEILRDFPQVDVVVCPIGGGGLISGVCTAIKSKSPKTIVIGVEPSTANDAQKSKLAGHIVPNESLPATIADGLRTDVGDLTWPFIRDFVDDIIDVSESEISKAFDLILTRMKIVIEPSSACVIAALLSPKFWKSNHIHCKNIAVIITGGNVDLMAIPSILSLSRP